MERKRKGKAMAFQREGKKGKKGRWVFRSGMWTSLDARNPVLRV